MQLSSGGAVLLSVQTVEVADHLLELPARHDPEQGEDRNPQADLQQDPGELPSREE